MVDLFVFLVGSSPSSGGVNELEVRSENVCHLQELVGLADENQLIECCRKGRNVQERYFNVSIDPGVMGQEGGDSCAEIFALDIEICFRAPGLEARDDKNQLPADAVHIYV